MRIAKALEYGASWVQTWREDVTHIIVDKGIHYKDVLSFLKFTSLPVIVLHQEHILPLLTFARATSQLSTSCIPQSALCSASSSVLINFTTK